MNNTRLKFVLIYDDEWSIVYPEDMDKNYDQFYLALEILNSDPLKGKNKLEKLIKEYPDEYIDAYVHLGYYYHENSNNELYKKNIEKAYLISKSLLPEGFDSKRHKISWSITENRGFLRSFHAKGLLLMERNDLNPATKIFKFLINVNPNDNQGIRYLLHDCYYMLGKYKSIISLFKKYQEDCSPEHYFGLGLIYFKQNLIEKAKDYLSKGIKYYPNVARDLISNKFFSPKKEYSESYFGVVSGGEVQGYEYRQKNYRYWNETEGALDFLFKLIPIA